MHSISGRRYLCGGHVLLSKNSAWISNTALDAGGAIYATFRVNFNTKDSLVMELHDSAIERNKVYRGGKQT